MNIDSVKETRQHDNDKFMKLDELSKSTKIVGKFTVFLCRNSIENDSYDLL